MTSPSPEAMARIAARIRELHGAGPVVLADMTAAMHELLNPDGVPLCDFCAMPLRGRHTVFHTRPFTRTDPELPVITDLDGDWAACAKCAPLFERQAWRRLASRALTARSDLRFLPAGPAEHREKVALFLAVHNALSGPKTEEAA